MINVSALRQRYSVESKPLRMERRVELAALAVTALLLLQLVYSVLRVTFMTQPDTVAPPVDLLAGTEVARLETVDARLSNELRSRPLFWVSRRPLEPLPEEPAEADQQAAEAGALKKVRLVGIFGVGDSAGIITLMEGQKRRLLIGDDIEGWTLDGIQRDRATFKNQGKTRELQLKPMSRKGGGQAAPGQQKNEKSSEQTT